MAVSLAGRCKQSSLHHLKPLVVLLFTRSVYHTIVSTCNTLSSISLYGFYSYVPDSWTSSNTAVKSPGAWLYRFDPTTASLLDVRSYSFKVSLICSSLEACV
jgi:hypothetical protein